MSQLLAEIENTIYLGRRIRFEKVCGSLIIEIEENPDKGGKIDQNRLPLNNSHFNEERISDCIKFQNQRLDAEV